IEAEIVGLGAPHGEGVEASALDSLFGDTQFREYADDLITAPPPRTSSDDGPRPPRPPRGPLPRTQKILMGIAGGLLAALVLVALFLLGTRLSDAVAPPAATPTPTATPGLIVLPIGPVEPGDYPWDQLLGGECLEPYESAWQDSYTVVDCAIPHPAQMVYRGVFDDTSSALYPGLEELQKRINLLCTAPTVIDYAKAGAANDIQVEASFAVDATDWDDGNRTYFCFVSRAGGDDLTLSIAIPQLVSTPTPSATPAG
ncbi:MAG: large membrane associated protein, partial [Rhodoglobus sp.]